MLFCCLLMGWGETESVGTAAASGPAVVSRRMWMNVEYWSSHQNRTEIVYMHR